MTISIADLGLGFPFVNFGFDWVGVGRDKFEKMASNSV
jgi:hypothetical protein